MEKKPNGRPRKYSESELLQKKIDQYFKECKKREVKYTVPGLALALGFVDRHSIWEYGQHEKFSHTIKRAMLKIEQQRAEDLLTENNPVGKIFDLKNNFKWKDQHDVKVGMDEETLSTILNALPEQDRLAVKAALLKHVK